MADRFERPDGLATLLESIRQERGLDLASYKESFLRRRLDVRLQARGCPDYASYGRLLRQDREEFALLLEVMSINLTRFFRDASTFQAIEEEILPQLLAARAGQRRLRVWSAGCAAGEEPYSLAIMLRGLLGADLPNWQLEIVATDIDRRALQRARRGVYDLFSFRALSPRYQAQIDDYFTRGPQRQLDDRIRDMVHFERHNLAHDPAPVDLDLILCRNVLIYFERPQQERLYRSFHRVLREDGFLVLGKTEVMPMKWSPYFPVVNVREHIYRRAEPDEDAGGAARETSPRTDTQKRGPR